MQILNRQRTAGSRTGIKSGALTIIHYQTNRVDPSFIGHINSRHSKHHLITADGRSERMQILFVFISTWITRISHAYRLCASLSLSLSLFCFANVRLCCCAVRQFLSAHVAS